MEWIKLGYSFLFIISCLSRTAVASYDNTFEWKTGKWSSCVYRPPGICCSCYSTRDVTCVFRNSTVAVPLFYCRRLLVPEPVDKETCGACQQECVMTSWSPWSACSETCTPATRYRVRAVLLLPTEGGKECGPLTDLEPCQNLPHCSFIDPRPKYTWKIGGWTRCLQVNNESECGPGLRRRQVDCVNSDGTLVANNFCQHYVTDEATPATEESCRVPCDCVTSVWSEWGSCSRTCHKPGARTAGYQARTRNIDRKPQPGGVGCPALKETRPCDTAQLPGCPRPIWQTSDWNKCRLLAETTSDTVCGAGQQTREVVCIEEEHPTMHPVPDILCEQAAQAHQDVGVMLKPTGLRACEVPCPRECQMAEWQNWSSCTRSCGPGGHRIRVKPVLISPSNDSEDCTELMQTAECKATPCMWWHTGRWSQCFLDDAETGGCGEGYQIRNVYCLSSLDEVLPDKNCTEDSKPEDRRTCHIPCSSDCDVSDWATWGPCSASCGARGGIQYRDRRILGRGSGKCLSEDELQQVQVCNQKLCKSYIWQVTAWSICARLNNASTPCGENTGIQNRTVHCERDPGFPTNVSYCDASTRPPTEQLCAARCPQDCVLGPWSEWSACSHTCGQHSQRIRYREILVLALHGGLPCPPKATSNACNSSCLGKESPQPIQIMTARLVLQKKRCKKVPPCYRVSWLAGEWGSCTSLDQCGPGVHTRDISCVRSDNKTLKDGECYERGLGSPPVAERRCHVPCSGDCSLSEWTKFSSCTQSCGTRPGTKQRSRTILNLDPRLPAESQCPHIKTEDLVESITCGRKACPTYHWETGLWGSCIIRRHTDGSLFACGDGMERRHVFCARSDGIHVSNHHCDVVEIMPHRHRNCIIPCPVDCVLSHWSPWNNCTHACGIGTKTRHREIVRQSAHGGHKCRHLEESVTCILRLCQDFNWEVAQWGACRPLYGLSCGRAQRRRAVRCPAGPALIQECAKRSIAPEIARACHVPCFGDCVMTEWSDWTACSCGVNATQTSRRRIRQHALPSATQCGRLKRTRPCTCENYRLVIGPWTSCQVHGAGLTECGQGTRQRQINCERSRDGVVMSHSYCHFGNLTLTESCELPCPIDCDLSEFTPWSSCTKQCGHKAFKQRSRIVMRESNEWGRRCPLMDQLTQNTTCHTNPCYTYSWSRGPWSECSVSSTTCGVGSRSRTIKCLRTDGETVDHSNCLASADDRYAAASYGKTQGQSDAGKHNLIREESCGTPCPGDCMVSEWSEYGPCVQNCNGIKTEAVQYRSRAVIRDALGGRNCPKQLTQFRLCSQKEMVCPVFYWKTGDWNRHGRRKVFCTLHGGSRLSSGCLANEKPSSLRHCVTQCGEYARCDVGRCVCDPGFTGDGKLCLPEHGCVTHAHCVINNTVCNHDNKECLCYGETIPDQDFFCLAPVKSSGPIPLKGLNTMFTYLLFGILGLLVLLGIICCTILIWRRRCKEKNPKVNAAALMKIDNLDANNYKNNELNHIYQGSNGRSPYSTYKSNKLSAHESATNYDNTSWPFLIDAYNKSITDDNMIDDFPSHQQNASRPHGTVIANSPHVLAYRHNKRMGRYMPEYQTPGYTSEPETTLTSFRPNPVKFDSDDGYRSLGRGYRHPIPGPDDVDINGVDDGSNTVPRSHHRSRLQQHPGDHPGNHGDHVTKSFSTPDQGLARAPNGLVATPMRRPQREPEAEPVGTNHVTDKNAPSCNGAVHAGTTRMDPTGAQHLLEYCDELIADLERVAKS